MTEYRFCDAMMFLKERLEKALNKKKGLRKEIKSLIDMMNEAGSEIEKICNEEHEAELKIKNKNQYFS